MRVLLLLLTASAAYAGEYALLANGTRMHVDRHEVDGPHVRLYKDSGYIEILTSNVTGYEVEEALPAPPVVVAPPPVEM